MTNPVITIGFGQGGKFFATLGYFAAKSSIVQPRPPTTIKDVFRGPVTTTGAG